MSKFTTNSNNRGFTLVELLIVIVIIAILAAISIVAYNGIQSRARNSAAQEAASQLSTKVESWYTINGSYPTAAEVTGGLVDSSVPVATEAKMDQGLIAEVGTTAPIATGKKVQYELCPVAGTGARITYLVENGTNGVITRGAAPATGSC